jgi:hypothetical protein
LTLELKTEYSSFAFTFLGAAAETVNSKSFPEEEGIGPDGGARCCPIELF